MKSSSFRRRIPCVLAALGLVLAGQASASILLYSDDFSGSATDPLHGTTPTTTIGTNTWNAATGWRADGTNPSSNTGGQSAFLPFSPSAGFVYTLTATLDQPTGNTWAALGFVDQGIATDAFNAATNNPAPWMLYRTNGNVDALSGPGTTGVRSFDIPYTGPQTFTIELDTTGPQWTVEWFVGADSIFQATYATNPTINFVGIGRVNSSANFSSFTLTMTPEPSTALLGAMGMLTLLLRRRRC